MTGEPGLSQTIPGIDPGIVHTLLARADISATIRHTGCDVRSTSHAACARMERSLLTLARFTLARQHHRHTVQSAGRLPREHPIRRITVAQCSVLAVVEHLGCSAPVDVARVLTLHRSTVLRHLQALEAAGLVHRDLGTSSYPFVRPLFVVTHEGRGAVRLADRLRVRRLERVATRWSPELCELVAACLELLASDLHDQVEPWELPREMGGRGYVARRHILWMHREPPAERRQGQPLAGGQVRLQGSSPRHPVGFS